MNQQGSLLDSVGRPTFRASDPDTSREAGKDTASKELQRERVLETLRAAGARGLTDFEGEQATGILRNTFARRRKDLQQMGFVVATDERRRTDTGATAIVWRIR